MRTTGKQCGLAATGDYQPSLRSPWLAADDVDPGAPLNPLTGRLAQVFATGFALADRGCMNGLNRAGV
ncbi:hypothetical protein, partial [Thiolapillus sp.]